MSHIFSKAFTDKAFITEPSKDGPDKGEMLIKIGTEEGNIIDVNLKIGQIGEDFFHYFLRYIARLAASHGHALILVVPKGSTDDAELAGIIVKFKSLINSQRHLPRNEIKSRGVGWRDGLHAGIIV